MSRAYLSHKQLKQYLTLLEHCGLIATNVETGRYKVTKKGEQFTMLYAKIHELVPNAAERNENSD